MEKYQEEGRIGQGAYGVVIKARAKQSGQVVAVKKMSLSRDRLIIVREICSLRNLCHPNILRLIDCFCSTDTISIVTEFVSFHLNDIFSDPRRPKDEQFARYFYAQILKGVAHIHSLNVMHRDLKPENILVTSLLVVKIADFGQACLYFPDEPEREYEENVATRWYRAPELLFGSRHYGLAVDVWALGCILTEFFNSTPLIQGRTDIEQISKIFSLLGTPTELTWPSWSALPDSSKLVFEEQQPPQTLSSLDPFVRCKIASTDQLGRTNFLRHASECFVQFLSRHLQLDSTRRSSIQNLLTDEYMHGRQDKPSYRIIRRQRPRRSMPLLARR